jgi:AcrR family transcriptional regulator
MATQQQRSETTRTQLLKAFRTAFLKRGFEETTTQEVLAQTGLSKGALYHHFRSKTEIVEALYEEESARAIARALRKVDSKAPPLDQLKAACMAWTQEVRSPGVSRVLFEIGPSALGPQRAKEIEDANSQEQIESLLKQAAAAGDLGAQDPKLIAAFLNALVAEAALHALRTRTDTTDVLADAIDGLFSGLRP